MKFLLSPCARSVLIVSTLLFSGHCTFAAEPSREVENWGTFEDPSERASLQVGEESVVITSEKNMLTIDNPLGKMPRIIRDVKGNFDARVRISGDFVDEYQEAVVLAMVDQRNYLAISCGSGRYRVDEISTTIVVEGGLADHQFNPATNTTAWLRVRRKGDELKSFYSYDGLHWIESASSSELASVGLAFGTSNAIGMTIGFIVQYVACMPFGWFGRFCVRRIQKTTQHQMPDLKDEKDRIE